MSKDTSGSAFPVAPYTAIPGSGLYSYSGSFGLTKREYFAGLAMQGTIASQTPDESIDPARCAQWCFEMADAMIAEGNK